MLPPSVDYLIHSLCIKLYILFLICVIGMVRISCLKAFAKNRYLSLHSKTCAFDCTPIVVFQLFWAVILNFFSKMCFCPQHNYNPYYIKKFILALPQPYISFFLRKQSNTTSICKHTFAIVYTPPPTHTHTHYITFIKNFQPGAGNRQHIHVYICISQEKSMVITFVHI